MWGEKYGDNDGNSFSELGIWGTNKNITGIRFCGVSDLFLSIEVQVENVWQGEHGRGLGYQHISGETLILDKDEHFSKVKLIRDDIAKIQFITNKSRSIGNVKSNNKNRICSEGGDDKRLVDIRGLVSNGNIIKTVTQLEFLWIDSKELKCTTTSSKCNTTESKPKLATFIGMCLFILFRRRKLLTRLFDCFVLKKNI